MKNRRVVVQEQKDLENQAIIKAATDYYAGWYAADAERIGRSLHSGLAKRAIRKDQQGKEYLYNLTKDQMLEKTREGGGSDTPSDKQRFSVTLLDRYEEIAVVKAVANEYIDYLELARQDGHWLIVNALWTDNREKQ